MASKSTVEIQKMLGGWFAIGTYSSRSFDTESDAVATAKASISWLASVIAKD